MKKTLALALVAAMAISMASMTAFAKVEYSDEGKTDVSTITANVTLTDEEMAKAFPGKYVYADGKLYKYDANKEDKKGDEVEASATDTVAADKVGVTKTYDDTPTMGFEGWEDVNMTRAAGTWTGTAHTKTKTYSTDEEIEEHLKEMEKAKKDADTAKDNNDKLQKLDEKYGANTKDDNTNGYDGKTGKAVKITADAGERIKKVSDDMSDFANHAIKVAGVTDDENKTWVFDVKKTDGVFGEGNTARVEFDLGFTDADLSKFTWKVYHIEGWCKAEKVKNVEIVGNKLYVWTDKFSPFVVTRGDVNASAGADASNPSTGDFSAVPVALLAAAALGATGFVAYKKRKAE